MRTAFWDAILKYWPIISGVGAGLLALLVRSERAKIFYAAFADRRNLARDTAELRKRFTAEVERADFWERRCDDLEKQFRTGLQELARIKRALRAYKQIIHDLLVDREALREWGSSLALELVKRGEAAPAIPPLRTLDLNIINPTDEVTYES